MWQLIQEFRSVVVKTGVVRGLAALSMMLLVLLVSCNREEDASTPEPVVGGIEITAVPRQTICHYTGATVLPYVEIAISDEAVERHKGHDEDLIPAPSQGCPQAVADTGGASSTGTAQVPPGGTQAAPAATAKPTQAGLCTAEDQTIGDFIRYDERFSQFEEVLNEAGVLPLLDEGIVLTLFAPTNDAFDSVDNDDLDQWLNDPGDRNALVLYHITEDDLTVDELDDLSTLEMISGELVRIKTESSKIILNDDTHIIEEDVTLCNGLVQVIDDVLVPPVFTDKPDITPTPQSTRTPQPTPTREPTDTPRPKSPTPKPTSTSVPKQATPTAIPTRTPAPTSAPTSTPKPDPTDVPPPTSTSQPDPTDAPPPTATPDSGGGDDGGSPTEEPTNDGNGGNNGGGNGNGGGQP
jgi:uncharacterized surface protein with fasciclin (FAS1) repeats